MAKFRVFIDGESGTTGLQIRKRLSGHPHIELVMIEQALRKDADAKRKCMSSVDITVLCLPDDAAREAASLARDAGCRVLDASSAHRTAEDWVFGLPELSPEQRRAIAGADAVSNPGCYATGAILLLQPLVHQQRLSANTVWCINAVSGYSGGGTKMMERYQQPIPPPPAYAAYGLGFDHKHIPEIQKWSGLSARPIFLPAVGNYGQGMLVFIPIASALIKGVSRQSNSAQPGLELHQLLSQYYQHEKFIKVNPYNQVDVDTAPYLTPHGMNGSNQVELTVFGSATNDGALLVAKLDNLGKGASGAAVQNLNIMLGLEESLCTGLDA